MAPKRFSVNTLFWLDVALGLHPSVRTNALSNATALCSKNDAVLQKIKDGLYNGEHDDLARIHYNALCDADKTSRDSNLQ